MARQTDVFGFDELKKAFEKTKKKYDSESVALLDAASRQIAKRERQLTPKGEGSKKPGTLKKSYRVLKPKKFKGGKVLVARAQNAAPHMHLFELGHEVYHSKGKVGKVSRYNSFGRRTQGITHHGRVAGRHVVEKATEEYARRFPRDVQKMMDIVTKDLQV